MLKDFNLLPIVLFLVGTALYTVSTFSRAATQESQSKNPAKINNVLSKIDDMNKKGLLIPQTTPSLLRYSKSNRVEASG